MTIVLCLDDRNGIAFNHRRQSRDRFLIEDLIKHNNVCIMEHSIGLLVNNSVRIINNISELTDDSIYFHEITDPKDIVNQFDTIIIYRWNRHYPSDVTFDLNTNMYYKIQEKDFVGFSHDKITKEVYQRK